MPLLIWNTWLIKRDNLKVCMRKCTFTHNTYMWRTVHFYLHWPEQSWTFSSWECLQQRARMLAPAGQKERSPGFPVHIMSQCAMRWYCQSKVEWQYFSSPTRKREKWRNCYCSECSTCTYKLYLIFFFVQDCRNTPISLHQPAALYLIQHIGDDSLSVRVAGRND